VSTTVVIGILTAIAGSLATVAAQWLKGRQEAAVKADEQEHSGQNQFVQQLLDAAGRVPELLREVERLMTENARLNGERIVAEAKFVALEQRVHCLESEKAGLVERMTTFLQLEEENIRLKAEIEQLVVRVVGLERSVPSAKP